MSPTERKATVARLEKAMREAAQMLEFEYAAVLRDQIIRLKEEK
jgi:excinuclease ABC subunit B